MASQSKPNYGHLLLGVGCMLFCTTLSYHENGLDTATSLFLSFTAISGLGFMDVYLITCYNNKHPGSPIRLWVHQYFSAAGLFVIGLSTYFANIQTYWVFLLVSLPLVATGTYYYLKQPARLP